MYVIFSFMKQLLYGSYYATMMAVAYNYGCDSDTTETVKNNFLLGSLSLYHSFYTDEYLSQSQTFNVADMGAVSDTRSQQNYQCVNIIKLHCVYLDYIVIPQTLILSSFCVSVH